MTAPITGMYCDRCGARHEFGRARPGGVARLRELTRGVRGYVLNEAPTFGDAMTDAWARLEEDGALEQYAEVHKTFSFCLDCRGYVCHDCWNAEAGRCLTCVPLPGTEAAAESLIASRLDLVAGPVDAASTPAPPATPAEVAEVAEVAVEPPASAIPGASEPSGIAGEVAADVDVDAVDAVARLAEMGMAPDEGAVEPETVDAGIAPGAERGGEGVGPSPSALASPSVGAAPVTASEGTTTTTPQAHRGPRPRRPARHVRPQPTDDDADVIAAAVAAGIILPPTAPPPAAPRPDAAGALAAGAGSPAGATEQEAILAEAHGAEAEEAEETAAEVLKPEVAVAAEALAEAPGAEAEEAAAAEVLKPEVAGALAPERPIVLAATQDIAGVPEPTAAEVAGEILPSGEGEVGASPPVSATAPVWPSRLRTPVPAGPSREEPAARIDVAPAAETTTEAVAMPTEPAAATPRPRRASDRRRPAPPPRRSPAPVHCRHCGLQVPAVARFCRRCGGRQTEDVPVST
jgi:hypothetical protein